MKINFNEIGQEVMEIGYSIQQAKTKEDLSYYMQQLLEIIPQEATPQVASSIPIIKTAYQLWLEDNDDEEEPEPVIIYGE